jgi:hypothetical protein
MAATFDDDAEARRVAEALERRVGAADVTVTGPGDTTLTGKLEPEVKGIWRTGVRSHLILGGTGLVLGLLAGALATAWNTAGAASSPFMAVFALGLIGLFGGLVAAGLLTLRPDHAWVIRKVRSAIDRRHWAVIVRPRHSLQAERAWELLERSGGVAVRSL